MTADGSTATSIGNFGPFAGRRAIAMDVGLDNKPRVLWASVDGRATVSTWNTSGTAQESTGSYGPFTNWIPTDIGVGDDNKARILFNNTADGTSSVWTLNTAGTAPEFKADYKNFSIPGYSAVSISIGADNRARLLWSATPSAGKSIVSRLNTFGTATEEQTTLTAEAGWQGRDLSVGADNVVRLLWNQAATNKASVWTLNPAMTARSTSADYGPFEDWETQALTMGPDNKPRLAWRYLSERVSYWQLNSAGTAVESRVNHQGVYPVNTKPGSVKLSVNAKSQCVKNEAEVAVRASNQGKSKADIRLATSFGDKKFRGVAAGEPVYKEFGSGSKKVKAGEATVAGYTSVNGLFDL